jgi:hypothetical protein
LYILLFSTILLYIQPAEEAQLNLDSKSKFSMKVRNSKKKQNNNQNFLIQSSAKGMSKVHLLIEQIESGRLQRW